MKYKYANFKNTLNRITKNDKIFNGGKLLKFGKNPNETIEQMKLSIIPDEYIPAQLSLFNTEPFSTKCD